MTTPTLHQAAQMALDAPMPEPAAWKHDCAALCTNDVELWIDACPHCGKPRTAPPAAPADDHATPSGGQEAGPQEDRIEAAYWRFDARHKGYSQWKTAPMSERDAFKAEMRNALEAEKVRAEMRLVARGWRRPDAPAAPAPAAPVVPLTDEQIRSMWLSSEFRGNGGQVDWFCEGIRAAEAHHGITGGSK